MKDASPQTIYLSDYTPFGWQVADVHLTVKLAPNATRVVSRIHFQPNPMLLGIELHPDALTHRRLLR